MICLLLEIMVKCQISELFHWRGRRCVHEQKADANCWRVTYGMRNA